MNKQRELAGKTATTDARVEYESNDPMTVLAVFSHLREVLGMPDIGDVDVSLSVEFQNLSDDQMATLEALGGKGWGLSHTEVLRPPEHSGGEGKL